MSFSGLFFASGSRRGADSGGTDASDLGSQAYVVALAGNDDGINIEGASVALKDLAVPNNPPVSSLFYDEDLDVEEIGGHLYVTRAVDEEDVTAYEVFWGKSATASRYSSDCGTAITGVERIEKSTLTLGYATFEIPYHSVIPTGVTHLFAFSSNEDGDGRMGISFEITDRTNQFPTVAVQGVTFQDTDLDLDEIAGLVAWVPPASLTTVQTYAVFVAMNQDGALRQQIGVDVPKSEAAIGVVPESTQLVALGGRFSHVVVYTKNFHGLGLPFALQIVDRALPVDLVQSLEWLDKDPDIGALGGVISWTAPANPENAAAFSSFMVYMSEDADGANQVLMGEVDLGTNVLNVPYGFPLVNWTHVKVFTKNPVGECLTAAAVTVEDRFLPVAVVENIAFLDQDLGTDEIGGVVRWAEPAEAGDTHGGRVEHWRAYLVEPGVLEQFVSSVPLGSDGNPVPFNTPIREPLAAANFTEIIVVASNYVGEALENASVVIADNTPKSCPSDLSHDKDHMI